MCWCILLCQSIVVVAMWTSVLRESKFSQFLFPKTVWYLQNCKYAKLLLRCVYSYISYGFRRSFFGCYVNATEPHQWEINISSTNGSVSSDNNPLPKLDQIYVAIWCQRPQWVHVVTKKNKINTIPTNNGFTYSISLIETDILKFFTYQFLSTKSLKFTEENLVTASVSGVAEVDVWLLIKHRLIPTCLTHWRSDKIAANFLTIFPNAFSWVKIYKFGDFTVVCCLVSN